MTGDGLLELRRRTTLGRGINPRGARHWGAASPLEGWITCASTPRASSQRASQKPSRPASKATAIRVIVRPALTDSSRQRCSRASRRSGLGSSFLRG